MENIYLIIVVVLFLLAASDLIVGVSNDAVNFLNSAIGSKAAPFRVIMAIAALGILVGATFSSGMMEVARKGIFHPGQFVFAEIMIIFLAVMITDVILLDLFNTFALPTSTTVSIVFELLGAAVAISILKIKQVTGEVDINTYINSAKALAIISGILLSVIIAFTVGSIVQYITRIIFSFNYNKTLRLFGSIWGGIAIAAITYFILIKGAKGSSFISKEYLEWIQHNHWTILLYSFVSWTILLQILVWLFRVNILRIIVLVGTFALAMAFAGNDLVNFIGVPLAGYESFKAFMAEPGALAEGFSMVALKEKVQTPTSFLLIAGLIMVITLWLSRKARSVVKTELNLSNQDTVRERFESTMLARTIVRQFIFLGNFLKTILPKKFLNWLEKRFNKTHFIKEKKKSAVSFDLLRASVNLFVASSLIAYATSLKLPLSTTYVTFMVAMGTSLADGAWGRESAVYRITGVVTVVGGWFFTAFSAFTAAFLVALILKFGGIIALGALIILAIYLIFRTHYVHKNRIKTEELAEKKEHEISLVEGDGVYENCTNNIISSLLATNELYTKTIKAFSHDKRKKLKKNRKEIKKFNKDIKDLKNNVHITLLKLEEEDSVESGHYYIQVLDYLRETAHCLTFIVNPLFEHIDNNHGPFKKEQLADLSKFVEMLSEYISICIDIISKKEFHNLEKSTNKMNKTLDLLTNIRKKQLKRMKKESLSTRNSLLYLDILMESRNLVLYINNLVKATRDFILLNKPSFISTIYK